MCTAISKGRHLLSLEHFTKGEIYELLRVSRSLKLAFKQGPVEAQPRYLQGESLAMIFQKRSTRTRVSSETGMFKLGGHSLFLGKEDIQLGHGETLMDPIESSWSASAFSATSAHRRIRLGPSSPERTFHQPAVLLNMKCERCTRVRRVTT